MTLSWIPAPFQPMQLSRHRRYPSEDIIMSQSNMYGGILHQMPVAQGDWRKVEQLIEKDNV